MKSIFLAFLFTVTSPKDKNLTATNQNLEDKKQEKKDKQGTGK